MRRNYGSLNLAALDLSSTSATVDHSGNCFHESLTHELANLEVVESDDCASIGFPMEHFAMAPDNDDAYARADAPRCRKRSLSEHGLDAEMRAAAASTSACTSTATSSCIPITSALVSAAPVIKVTSSSYTQPQYQHQIALDLPPRLVEQHHIELNALRCLSLKMMLSASSASSSSSSNSGKALVPQLSTSMPKVNSFEFDMGCLPQNDRVKTTLIAARRGSLPRNMIQSV
jgi:hypothetical protein